MAFTVHGGSNELQLPGWEILLLIVWKDCWRLCVDSLASVGFFFLLRSRWRKDSWKFLHNVYWQMSRLEHGAFAQEKLQSWCILQTCSEKETRRKVDAAEACLVAGYSRRGGPARAQRAQLRLQELSICDVAGLPQQLGRQCVSRCWVLLQIWLFFQCLNDSWVGLWEVFWLLGGWVGGLLLGGFWRNWSRMSICFCIVREIRDRKEFYIPTHESLRLIDSAPSTPTFASSSISLVFWLPAEKLFFKILEYRFWLVVQFELLILHFIFWTG